ncbi:hypothetical protein ABFU65_21255 [Xanthomonas campestris pv. raphani]|uniref:hypothetical protein n=1 Tax=Xanthomonas campestris TaxID=339 RepID=UPI00216A049D|nr:hypothetical protein [Xanthomonas campestris]MCS3847891.1 hypothetical protein [Xanthomonas campestris]MEA9656186.1 hypothetical protein [Xanthomonas campestris pv. raphani]
MKPIEKDDTLDHCRSFLAILELALRASEAGMARPMPVLASDYELNGYILRLPVRDIHHAMLLKQAASLHYLYAAVALCDADLFMAQGAAQRMADEATDDVCFLAQGIIQGETPLHEKFLASFWSDHDEAHGNADNVRKAHSVRREKIHAALNANSDNPSRAGLLAKRLHKTYSGFVHASSANVMDLYDAYRHTFCVESGPAYLRPDHVYDFWNYCYRAGLAFLAAAKAYGSASLFSRVEEGLVSFQRVCGRDGGYKIDDAQ